MSTPTMIDLRTIVQFAKQTTANSFWMRPVASYYFALFVYFLPSNISNLPEQPPLERHQAELPQSRVLSSKVAAAAANIDIYRNELH